jgi:hypothetical protein
MFQRLKGKTGVAILASLAAALAVGGIALADNSGNSAPSPQAGLSSAVADDQGGTLDRPPALPNNSGARADQGADDQGDLEADDQEDSATNDVADTQTSDQADNDDQGDNNDDQGENDDAQGDNDNQGENEGQD